MVKRNCDFCGVETLTLVKTSDGENKKDLCINCYNEQLGNIDPTIEILAKPKHVRIFRVTLSRMGTYKDSDEIRYVMSIPRDRKGEFDFERLYDVIFIKR